MTIDYTAEKKKIHETENFWKAKPGQHRLTALSELEETEPFVQVGTNGQPDKITPQAKVSIRVDGETKTWTMGKGGSGSAFGQLVNLAIQKGNKLTGVEFQVIVKLKGDKNDYTIVL